MLPVAVHAPVVGSYNSALASVHASPLQPLPIPPTSNTLPPGSSVAVCWLLAWTSDPVAAQRRDEGSYSSAVAPDEPPATSTFPFASKVAVWLRRPAVRLPT